MLTHGIPMVLPAKPAPAVLLSFDIEEFDVPEEYGAVVPEAAKFEISCRGTLAILDLLDSQQIHATFFVTGAFAKRYPDLVVRMAQSGHEIASHGMNHSAFELEDLACSRERLSRISGQKVVGLRMPRLAQVPLDAIVAAGYRYDSSMNPTWLPGRYCNFDKPCGIYREEHLPLLRVPVSVTKHLRFPLFWLSFKNLPLWGYRWLVGHVLRQQQFFSLYTHPWEYVAEAADPKWNLPKYLIRHAGAEQLNRLEAQIKIWKQQAVFQTIHEFLTPLYPDAQTQEKGIEKL